MPVFRPNIQRLVASGNIQGLISAAQYNDPDMRRNAVAALGRFKDQRVYHALVYALRDDYQPVRIEAIIALGKLRSPSFIRSLQWSLNDADPMVRMNTVWALGQIGGKDVVKPLILSMADNDRQVRVKAVETVCSLGKLALPELRKAIAGRNQLIRQNVITVLGKMKVQDLVPEIIRTLDDPVLNVRENATWALGNIGDPRAVPNLEKINSNRAQKSLNLIKEGPHWKTVADNFEKAGRYEDSAVIHEMKSEWEEAGRLRNKAKEPIQSQNIPQFLANNLNLRQETIIKDSVISRSRIGKGVASDSVISRSNVQGEEIRNDIRNRSSMDADTTVDRDSLKGDTGSGNDGIGKMPAKEGEGNHGKGAGGEVERAHVNESGKEENRTHVKEDGNAAGKQKEEESVHHTTDGYKICPFCGMELKFDRSPNYCPYCAERL